ncbi:unnamed protein product [Didymodactylos carnosus]|uniref:SAP domain-containing protein n=1 Tax=Didymodactylos carnosus TaxID=1234261 RepID=A0A813TB42_9BILA|nr:unnamed protein product [Didymodactylos carnosus]CAF0845674.1 unnamed protein product [Didymodactylos carnosus]CAF3597779.1 unnamed protein product [Didymodactylos carnosus]CAF3630937.1 unnamed protein product [Didymodactylos carnosus]
MAFKGSSWQRSIGGSSGMPMPMSYSSNANSLYPVMHNQATSLMGPSYSSSAKSLPYTGTVSNMYRDHGVIDNEISFKLNAISGPVPHVGDRVVCQMKHAEGYGAHKYIGYDVRSVDNRRQSRTTAPVRSQDTYMNRQPPRNSSGSSSMNSRRSINSLNTNNAIDPYSSRDRYNNTSSTSHADSGRQTTSHRSGHVASPSASSSRRSRSRTGKTLTPKRRPPPKYSVLLPKGPLDCSELNVIQLRSRYSRLHIPSDFFHASYKWHDSMPIDRPLKFIVPCAFHIFNKNVPRVIKDTAVLDPVDADYTWSVRVLLMSSPDIQHLITRACLVADSSSSKTSNPDDLEHPSKLIKFLVGVRHQNEYFSLGGAWSESLDGQNPDKDPQVLIRTAIRTVQAQSGIDLSKCIQWCRYLEILYHRPEEIHKGRLIDSRVEHVIVFLPDLSTCMPNSMEWEETSKLYKQICDETIKEELHEDTTPDEELQSRTATHHSKVDLDNMRVVDLKAELKARDQPVTGLKADLRKRLSKLIQQEKLEEEKGETTTKESEKAVSPPPSSGTKKEEQHRSTKAEKEQQVDVEKLRKEIETNYQLPPQRSILIHPTTAKGDKFDCRVVSLHYLLNYANHDTIKEKCFELYLFSECFSEMLMRDHSYKIYRSLYDCLEVKEVTSTSSTTTDTTTIKQEETKMTNDEVIEEQQPVTTVETDNGQNEDIVTANEEEETTTNQEAEENEQADERNVTTEQENIEQENEEHSEPQEPEQQQIDEENDETIEAIESGRKRKRSKSKEETPRKKSSTLDESSTKKDTRSDSKRSSNNTSKRDNTRSSRSHSRTKRGSDESKQNVVTRQQTVKPELLLSYTYFDRNRCGYLSEKDVEELLLLSGLSLTKNEVKMLVSRVAKDEKIQYRRLTDKTTTGTKEEHEVTSVQEESYIDPLAPKGNLLLLPQKLAIFGVRPESTKDKSAMEDGHDNNICIIGADRALKQLEIANKTQTALEAKIDVLKKEIVTLTSDLNSSEKSNRHYSEQLADTKKRLRDTQRDLKDAEDKYKRYSDAIYHLRNEARSSFDYASQILGKDKRHDNNGKKQDDNQVLSNRCRDSSSSKDQNKKHEKDQEDEEEFDTNNAEVIIIGEEDQDQDQHQQPQEEEVNGDEQMEEESDEVQQLQDDELQQQPQSEEQEEEPQSANEQDTV